MGDGPDMDASTIMNKDRSVGLDKSNVQYKTPITAIIIAIAKESMSNEWGSVMSSRVIVSFLCLFVLGCPQESKTNARSSAGAFDSNLVVRLDSPTNGATVQSPFVVEYTVGPGVDSFELMVSDVSVEDAGLDDDGQGSVEFEVDNGRHRITLEGWDSDGILLNEHRIDVNVVDMEGPWVTITTPTTGAVVSNPVLFGVEASEHIDSVEFQADEWPLGVVSPGELLTYEFDGTGYERSIEAFGYSDGELLATDNIQITVSDFILLSFIIK